MNRTTLSAPAPSSQKVLFRSQLASNIQQSRVAYKHRQAGPGTTRPPLPRNPSERLLKSMAMQASEITSMEPNPYEALASPIHLAHPMSRTAASQIPRMSPYGYQFFPPSSAGGVPASPSLNLQRPVATHARRNATPSTLSYLDIPTASMSLPVPYTPNPRRPTLNGSGSITVSTPTNMKPGIQQSGRQAPMLLSPLKVMFDNACRGIYSELSYLQSSCTAMMNRERKEKEMIRAHYFQMRRERDAARERIRVLEDESRSSSPEQKHPISQDPSVNPRKRGREGSESSESSSSSSGSLPRTPSPPAQITNEIAISDQYELVYPSGRSYTSSSPPPPSIGKASFTPPSTPSLNVSLSSVQPTLSSVPPRSAASSPSSQKPPVHRSSGIALKRSPSPGAMLNLDMPPTAKRRKVVCSTEDDAASAFRQEFFDTETSSGDRKVATSWVTTRGELGEVDIGSGSEGEAIGVIGNGSAVESSPRPMARSPSHSPKPSLSLPSLHDMYPEYPFS